VEVVRRLFNLQSKSAAASANKDVKNAKKEDKG
jgi:hypothetical protein